MAGDDAEISKMKDILTQARRDVPQVFAEVWVVTSSSTL
jgi:hypothetical protein